MITILTMPVGFLGILMRIRRFIFGFFYEGYANKYGGYPAVTRSLINGFERNKIDFNYNPINKLKIGETVVILNNIYALKQLIKNKKKWKIKKILAGPNMVNFPSEFNHLIASKEIDTCLVPSYNVKILYEQDSSLLKNRIYVWPAGVDEIFWTPIKNKFLKNKIIVYWKNIPEEFGLAVEEILKSRKWEVQRIVYGHYKLEDYKKCLIDSKFAVFLSRSESQGIALAEAWSMDVPILVYNPQDYIFKYKNKSFILKTSAPYLNDLTGKPWKTLTDLQNLLENINNYNFSPRGWVLKNMTDEISGKILLKIIKSL